MCRVPDLSRAERSIISAFLTYQFSCLFSPALNSHISTNTPKKRLYFRSLPQTVITSYNSFFSTFIFHLTQHTTTKQRHFYFLVLSLLPEALNPLIIPSLLCIQALVVCVYLCPYLSLFLRHTSHTGNVRLYFPYRSGRQPSQLLFTV